MNVTDVLERAADLMGMHVAYRHCVATAVRDVAGADAIPLKTAVYQSLALAAGLDGLQPLCAVITWHDTTDRAIVLSTMRACAAVERARAAVAESVLA